MIPLLPSNLVNYFLSVTCLVILRISCVKYPAFLPLSSAPLTGKSAYEFKGPLLKIRATEYRGDGKVPHKYWHIHQTQRIQSWQDPSSPAKATSNRYWCTKLELELAVTVRKNATRMTTHGPGAL